ncbi:unnamed protein product [Rhizopus stolonifer]
MPYRVKDPDTHGIISGFQWCKSIDLHLLEHRIEAINISSAKSRKTSLIKIFQFEKKIFYSYNIFCECRRRLSGNETYYLVSGSQLLKTLSDMKNLLSRPTKKHEKMLERLQSSFRDNVKDLYKPSKKIYDLKIQKKNTAIALHVNSIVDTLNQLAENIDGLQETLWKQSHSF